MALVDVACRRYLGRSPLPAPTYTTGDRSVPCNEQTKIDEKKFSRSTAFSRHIVDHAGNWWSFKTNISYMYLVVLVIMENTTPAMAVAAG